MPIAVSEANEKGSENRRTASLMLQSRRLCLQPAESGAPKNESPVPDGPAIQDQAKGHWKWDGSESIA
jgi:hypothetical protein